MLETWKDEKDNQSVSQTSVMSVCENQKPLLADWIPVMSCLVITTKGTHSQGTTIWAITSNLCMFSGLTEMVGGHVNRPAYSDTLPPRLLTSAGLQVRLNIAL